MKKITAVILSLSLILCSCGKSNESMVKREVNALPITVEKTIPIDYLGGDHEKIWGTTIDVKGVEGETTVSINHFKVAIPKDTCDIIDAHYWKDNIRKELTEKQVTLDEVERVELVCREKEVSHNSTPKPTPTASAIPSASETAKVKEEKTPWGMFAIFVVGFVVFCVTLFYVVSHIEDANKKDHAIAKLINTKPPIPLCREGHRIKPVTFRTLKDAVAYKNIVTIRSIIDRLHFENLVVKIPIAVREKIYVVLRGEIHKIEKGEYDEHGVDEDLADPLLVDIVQYIVKIGFRDRLWQDEEQFLNRSRIYKRYFPANYVADTNAKITVPYIREGYRIRPATLQRLRDAVNRKAITVVIHIISRLYVENLAVKIPRTLREKIYVLLREGICRILRRLGSSVFKTMVRAVIRIGFEDRLLQEPRWIIDHRSLNSKFMNLDFKDVPEIPANELLTLIKGTRHGNLTHVICEINTMYERDLVSFIAVITSYRVYTFLKKRLHELAELDEWPDVRNDVCVFQTMVRAVKKLGMYNVLMREERPFYIEHNVPAHLFALESLTDDFPDATEVGIAPATLQALETAAKAKTVPTVVDIISRLYEENLVDKIYCGLFDLVYRCLKTGLHELAELDEWPDVRGNESDVFRTMVRAMKRLGRYEGLMQDESRFYIEHNVPAHLFALESLTDDFPDVTEIGD